MNNKLDDVIRCPHCQRLSIRPNYYKPITALIEDKQTGLPYAPFGGSIQPKSKTMQCTHCSTLLHIKSLPSITKLDQRWKSLVWSGIPYLSLVSQNL